MLNKRISLYISLFFFLIFSTSVLKGQIILQRCDVTNLWEGSNAISVNTEEKKEGVAAISMTGSGTDWFKKKFSQTDVGIDESGWFSFWLYISDVSRFNGDGQVELTSSGVPDMDEYSWPLASLGLSNGWNHVKLQISAAGKTGSPDLKAISFFRIYQFLSGEVTAILDDLRFTTTMDPLPEEKDPLAIPTPDFTTLDGKVMFGYQGWFSHPDDGSELAQWRHWGTMEGASTLQVEMYPDLREHESDENYLTGLTFEDGRVARIYSAYNRKTVMRHMKWLRDYDLDGVFLQRFNVSLRDSKLRAVRDTVTVNVMLGCERYGRTFVNMYDLSGLGGGNIDDLIADWKHLVDDLKITESPNYLWHRGKPLVSLWGFTVRDDLSISDLEQAIEFFRNSPEEKYRASIMLGTNHDFFNRGTWASSLSKVDVISPWTVGRYNNSSSNQNFVNSYLKPGQDWCDQRNIDFLPVVWPGFSWFNLKREGEWQKNQIPRDGGNYFWIQASRAVSANAKSVYIAMFDEVDEATAMYKLTETPDQVPDQVYWLTLDADGYDLPSDWYLRCAKKLTDVVTGETDNHPVLGTPPDGIDDFSILVQSTKCGTTEGKITFNYPKVHADSLLEFSIDGGITYPYKTTAGSSSLETGALTSGTYDVWARRTDGSFPTDLGPYTLYDYYPGALLTPVNTICGSEVGELEITVDDNPYLGPIEISVDGGNTYGLTSTDGTWVYNISGLARGEYDVWTRWADESCPSLLETTTIGADMVPVTLYASVDGEEFQKFDDERNVVYACPGFSLDIYAEPAEEGWSWSWTGDLNYEATGRSVRIADQLTTEMYGKYYVSYRDEVNDCEVNDQLFFIRAAEDCPVGIGPETEGTLRVNVFPNPAGETLLISSTGKIESIQISDLTGRMIYTNPGLLNTNEWRIDLSGIESGTYIYHISGYDGNFAVGTFMKK